MSIEPPVQDHHELTEEVRIAMALNGGISLAIWMGGCAVELDAARRAHLGPEVFGSAASGSAPAPDPGPSTTSRFKRFVTGAAKPAPTSSADVTRTVYNGLCEAFKRELVVDLMSGASAGGINGAMLGCATAHDRRLHPDFVRSKWLVLGDLSLLLQRSSKPDPRSLMRGRYFHQHLLLTFQALCGDAKADAADLASTARPNEQLGGAAAAQADVPLLDVTTTDLAGTERLYADAWGEKLVAREYRARFEFRDREDYTAENLATAARSSASFPFAFEPWCVKDGPAMALAGFEHQRLVIDGGLLDNAPIKAVLDLIPERPAARQVKRYVCYLNADPPEPEASAPKRDEDEDIEDAPDDTPPPTLLKLGGALVGLPRKAPFVDQLDAIERATSRMSLAAGTELALLTTPPGDLTGFAQVLLPAYRRRRRLLSLEELLQHPASVRAAWRTLSTLPEDTRELPWVPMTLEPGLGGRWGWGLRPAQRAIHLLLDAVRLSIMDAREAGERARLLALLTGREKLYAQLQVLANARAKLMRPEPVPKDSAIRDGLERLTRDGGDVGAIVDDLAIEWCRYDQVAAACVAAAANEALTLVEHMSPIGARSASDALFGTEPSPQAFIHRACCVEVIRRAFDTDRDIDSAQQIDFVQLTPFTKVRIFQAPRRKDGSESPCPDSPEDKLAGIRLGHFAAFYRRAWRANDYMWGRLDASARIVEMLVDHKRALQLHELDPALAPWDSIAQVLLPSQGWSPDQIWLVSETLGETFGCDVPERVDDLRMKLVEALRADLCDGHGELARRMCQRAVQLEILRQELPVLDASSTTDRALGASSQPLRLKLGPHLQNAIESLRPAPEKQNLPRLLGARGSMEVGSNLGLRTATHVIFVALAALRFAKIPFARLLAVLRAVLFPIAASVARAGWYRFAVVAGFWAASSYLSSRVVVLSEQQPTAALTDVWSPPVLLSYIALLVVIGVIAVPALRAYGGGGWPRKIGHGACGFAVAAVGGIGAIVWALVDGLPWASLLAEAPDTAPPGNLQVALVATILGLPLAAKIPGLRRISRWLVKKRLRGAAMALALTLLSGWLVAWCIDALSGHLDLDLDWPTAVAWAATAGAPLVMAAYVSYTWLASKAPKKA